MSGAETAIKREIVRKNRQQSSGRRKEEVEKKKEENEKLIRDRKTCVLPESGTQVYFKRLKIVAAQIKPLDFFFG